ncbi:DUF6273 domain-containing protein [Paenibacillus eucommiae]|uniref:DUF6273 domain-containing protein n=1 Tax=Paenibacillus eucommiae TaxID=1355755 RepID=A0ABS4ISQ1_9BACL|nr:DUF6273 domain-containing protein [Paenibacillus eucommiae]MBP1990593.1 hypothetical protein [Paenibacillus eucommiae]
MKQKLALRISVLSLSLFLLLGMLLASAEQNTAGPLAGRSAATISGSAIENDWSWMTVNDLKASTTVFHFAGSEWYAVGYNGNAGGVASIPGTMTLFSVGGIGATAQFNKLGAAGNSYIDSDLRKELTTEVRFTEIDSRERSVMVSRSLEDAGIPSPEDQLWALSIDEANALNVDLGKTGAYWWLRLPGDANNKAATVNTAGGINVAGNYITSLFAVRPAFHLDLASVVFASAAEGGKVTTAGQALSAVTSPAQKAKLTVIDSNIDNLSLTVAQPIIDGIEEITYAPGDTVAIAYSDAKIAANKYVSSVITDNNGNVIHYGKLTGAESGTAVFTVPALANGSYTIKLFNEEDNGDRNTDYASEPVEINMNVVTTYTVSLPAGTGYTVIAQNGSSSPVNHGGGYSFKVELDEAYSKSTIEVKTNDTTVTPDIDGVYTISNITEDQTVTVTGIELNDIATATLNIQKDDTTWSDHGKMFTLKLSTDEAITTDMIGAGGTVTAVVPFGTWKIYEGSAYTGVNLTVDNTGGTETLNYYTVKFTVIDAE